MRHTTGGLVSLSAFLRGEWPREEGAEIGRMSTTLGLPACVIEMNVATMLHSSSSMTKPRSSRVSSGPPK